VFIQGTFQNRVSSMLNSVVEELNNLDKVRIHEKPLIVVIILFGSIGRSCTQGSCYAAADFPVSDELSVRRSRYRFTIG
jgi:hypothetical protein